MGELAVADVMKNNSKLGETHRKILRKPRPWIIVFGPAIACQGKIQVCKKTLEVDWFFPSIVDVGFGLSGDGNPNTGDLKTA